MTNPRRTFSNIDEITNDENENPEENIPQSSNVNGARNAGKRNKLAPLEKTMQAATSALKSISERPVLSNSNHPAPTIQPDKSADDLFGETIGKLMREIPDSYEKDMTKLEVQKLVYQLKHAASPTSSMIGSPPMARYNVNTSPLVSNLGRYRSNTPPVSNSGRYNNANTVPSYMPPLHGASNSGYMNMMHSPTPSVDSNFS